jgi:transcriptional regulator with GAF, ATPase, and Fis domain
MDPRIVAISGPLKGQEFQFNDGRVSVGRDPSNSVAPSDSAVSRRHCVVEWQDGRARITDLGSHNGTLVNGIPVNQRELTHGDVLRIGLSELVFLTEEVSSSELQQVSFGGKISSDMLKTVKLGDSEQWLAHPTDVGRMARDLNALVKLSQTIHSIRNVDELQHHLLRCVCEVVPADFGAILLLDQPDDDPSSVTPYHREGTVPHPLEIPRELVQRAVWEQSAVVAEDGAESSMTANSICTPLLGLQRTIGVLYLSSSGAERRFGDDHVHFLNSAVNIAAMALENLLALQSLQDENQRLRAEIGPADGMVGDGKTMRKIAAFIAKVAPGDSTVLICGESGTGKEVVARAIHAASPRAEQPFVAINCAAIPEALLESELFGHEKGSFTGAVATKKGKLEVAEGGTVLLDEIGEMPAIMQAKLLRVLQQREFDRIGGTRPIKLHARVLAATNKDLDEAIQRGEFRKDLFYRLNVVSVAIPPLRKRRDDIPLLAIYFATRYAQKCNRPFKGITSEAKAMLMNYEWPGNIRELENAIEHAIVMGASDEIRPEDLPEALLEVQVPKSEGARYHAAISDLKKRLIRDALAEADGSYTEAAKLLGVHANYLHRLIRNLDIKDELREQESE